MNSRSLLRHCHVPPAAYVRLELARQVVLNWLLEAWKSSGLFPSEAVLQMRGVVV